MNIRKAGPDDVPELQAILTRAWNHTYRMLYTQEYIDRIVAEFYNPERLFQETTTSSEHWSGYYVLDVDHKIVGCIGGGIIAPKIGSIFVLYLDPKEKRKGYGTILVNQFTQLQKAEYQITEQTVSVSEGNQMGLPFYRRLGFAEETRQKSYGSNESDPYYSITMRRFV